MTPPSSSLSDTAPRSSRRAESSSSSSAPADTKPLQAQLSIADGANGPASFDELYAKAQAMGLRLTREEYERTRAGITAFLKAERVSSSPAPPSQPSTSRPAPRSSGSSAPQPTSRGGTPSSSGPTPSSSSRGLSFFTAVVASPNVGHPSSSTPKPSLSDISSMAEKKRRRERRARKLAASLSEPETTPRMDGHPSSSSLSGYGSSPQCGLGLQGIASSSSSAIAATPDASPLESRRGRSRAASSSAALSSSADLQAATSEQSLSDRAWLSPSGKLRLVSPERRRQTSSSPQLPAPMSADDSGVVVVDDAGFDGATKAGWGSRRRTESGSSASVSDSMAKLGLLDRVMKDKRSPRRLKREAKAKEMAGQRSATEPRVVGQQQGAGAGAGAGAGVDANLGPSLPINEARAPSLSVHDARRHSRQPSRNLAAWRSSDHERMTTRDHYEFFVHGIAPGQQPGLGDIEVDDEILSSTPASVHEAMPWLFSSQSSRALSSPTVQRRGTFVSDDLAIDLSSMLDTDMEDLSSASLFNPRRGLLFPGSSVVQQSPTQPRTSSAGLNLFSAGFTDPSLSQSPARPLLQHMASSPARLARPRAGSAGAAGSPSVVRSRPHQHPQRLASSALSAAETISPAAVFGGGGVDHATLSMPPPPPPVQAQRPPLEQAQQQALPEPIKRERAATKEASPIVPIGQARFVPGQSATLSWGESGTANLVIAPTPAPASAPSKSSKKGGKSGGSGSATRRPASSTPATTQTTFSLPPNADMTKSEWDRPDGSRVVKLVSEELQAAIDAGGDDFVEPPPRYYVLPAGFGSTKAKPTQVSYAGLIGQAIKTSSDQRLSLAEVYQWISTVHPYFERGDRGWQNSIRHNLSLNKSFIKVEREANMPGKGGWWAIKEGHADRFQNGVYIATPGSGAPSAKKKQQPAAAATPAPAPAVTPASTASVARKRHPTNDTDSPQSSPSSKQGNASSNRRAQKSGKSLKKPKLGALSGGSGGSSGSEAASRLPLGVINNRVAASAPAPHHASYANVFESTPIRAENTAPYMASSGHGGMPMLTDSASSPPSSPPPTSDAVMPPPSSLGGPSSGRKGRSRHEVSGGYGGGFGGAFASQFSASQFSNPWFNGMGGFQASPLANRVRAGGNGNGRGGPAANAAATPGSPLRRTTATSLTGSPGKVASPPVSSVRDESQSSLAGAFAMRTGSGGAGGGSSSSFARSSPMRAAKQQGQHQFQQQSNVSPVRGGGGSLRFAQQGAPSPASSAQLQMAVQHQQPSYSNLGLGMSKPGASSSQLTPARGNLGAGLMGISPSPTVRRFQQQQAASSWLEDPFDYQGALQHELETMGLPTAASMAGGAGASPSHHAHAQMMSGVVAGGGHGGVAGWAGTPMMGVSPMRGGGGNNASWTGGHGDISAVRDAAQNE